MAFGSLTVGEKAFSAGLLKAADSKTEKKNNATTDVIAFSKRGSNAGAAAYNNFDWSQLA